jgi:acylphosphatase
MNAHIRRRVIVRGQVQNVTFRATCARLARERTVSGMVRNLSDQRSVEMVFEGDPHDVTALVEWARHGPPDADVGFIEVSDEPPEGDVGFAVA